MGGLIRRRAARIGAAVAMALLAALGALPARAAELRPWRHGILEAKSDAGIIMMVGNGFAEKAGLKLEISQFKNDVVELQALLAGELDSFEGGCQRLDDRRSARRRRQDHRLPLAGPALRRLRSAQHRTVKDLKGKTFAISAPGATPDVVARALLARDGVPASEVRFANLGSDLDRFKSLVAGVADATVVSGEYAPIAGSRASSPADRARCRAQLSALVHHGDR